MDDTMSALPLDQIQAFHYHSIKPSIQFTIEEESRGTITFLGVMIDMTMVPCLQPCFASRHQLAHKVAVTRTLLTRADRICTFQYGRNAEEHVSKALESNGYPRTVICQHWRPSLTSVPHPSPDMPKATITLPYVRHLAESIHRILALLDIQTTGHSDNP